MSIYVPFINDGLTVQELKELLLYEQDTGIFRWRSNRGRLAKCGDIAGTIHSGYTVIKVKKRTYPAHRLAWLYVYGTWPLCVIDHINGNRSDNRLVNLRLSSHGENSQNSKIRSDNKTGKKGVFYNQKFTDKKYVAYINHNKTRYNLGVYGTAEEASEVYEKVAKKLFGEFYRDEENR